jgi:RHS repeat-associated protein
LEGAGGIGGLLARSHGYASSNGNWYTHNCFHADGNGNVTYLVDSSQAKAASYRYDPYGNTISSSGSLASANVYRFSSKEIHANSGLYYYGYRWYDPNLQRWLNRDPVGDEGTFVSIGRHTGYPDAWLRQEALGNLYGFCHNGPPLFIDPDGRPVIAIPIIAGGIIIEIGQAVTIGAVVCLAIPSCRDAMTRLAQKVGEKVIEKCRTSPPDCSYLASTATLCLYKCSSPVGPFIGAIPKPPNGVCPRGASLDDVKPMPGRDYPGFPPK